MSPSRPLPGSPARTTAGWSRRRVLGMVPVGVAAVGLTGLPATSAEAAGRVVSVAYVEVNNHDLSVVGDHVLAGSGRPVFDIGIIFAANINYDTASRSAYLSLNERTQWTVDHADTQIRPLQAAGTKVLLSILGNHQGAGFANFPDRAAAGAFAQELADAVTAYGLDGIDIDDEYSDYGVNDTGQPNASSLVWLISELRDRLGPDKIISFYNIGPSSERTVDGGVRAGDEMDYAWNPYYGTWDAPEIPGMDRPQLSPGAVDLTRTAASRAKAFARRTVAGRYGVYLTYNLTPDVTADYLSSFTVPLYGARAVRRG